MRAKLWRNRYSRLMLDRTDEWLTVTLGRRKHHSCATHVLPRVPPRSTAFIALYRARERDRRLYNWGRTEDWNILPPQESRVLRSSGILSSLAITASATR